MQIGEVDVVTTLDLPVHIGQESWQIEMQLLRGERDGYLGLGLWADAVDRHLQAWAL